MSSVLGQRRAKGNAAVRCWKRKSFGRSWRCPREGSIPSLLHVATSVSILAPKNVAMSQCRNGAMQSVVGGLRGKWKDEASTSCLHLAFSLSLFGTSSIKHHHLRDLNIHQFISHH